MNKEVQFRKAIRQAKNLTHTQFEELAQHYGLTLLQANDELAIVNGYVGKRQW